MREQETTFYVAPIKEIGGDPNARRLWETTYDDGNTELKKIRQYGAKGWKIISVTPITILGTTSELLFTFTRDKE
ncbi:MAG: hypothetical protein MRJ65_01670 [Candidatus Brocadiaceae bacterium]|nr:hypothetical protein [Candidatus Brocadiaceae bacterium]